MGILLFWQHIGAQGQINGCLYATLLFLLLLLYHYYLLLLLFTFSFVMFPVPLRW